MIVAKFGGTSMASAAQIKKACDIILADTRRRIMVVSAPGKRFSNDTKITDLLIDLAQKALNGEELVSPLERVLERYRDIAAGLMLPSTICTFIEKDLRSRLLRTDLAKEQFMDLMKAAGEDLCARLVSDYLVSINQKAKYINPKDAGMILCGRAGNAHVLPESYSRLSSLKDEDGIVVFPGFFGYSKDGEVVTFSRGGSDVTGSILAAATNAELYENFTDVDNIFAADPRVIDSPAAVTEITYRQMRELAYAGFGVFHEAAVEPVVRARIPIHIKNTNNLSASGTRIVFSRDTTHKDLIAIAGTGGFCNLSINKFLMNNEIGFGRKLFQILEEEGISFDHAPSGIDNISPILRREQLSEDKLSTLKKRITTELDIDSMEVFYDLALMVLVCETVYSTKAVVARAVRQLTKSGIGISMLNMTSNSLSLTIGVSEKDLEKSLKVLYSEFFSADN